MFFIIRHFVIGLKILAPRLIDLKTALVHIEVYVALFKIWRAGLPNDSFGVQSLNRQPRTIADAFGVLFG